MKRKLLSLLGVMGALSLIGFCLPSCTPELAVRQDYSFSLSTLPVQKDIVKGGCSRNLLCASYGRGFQRYALYDSLFSTRWKGRTATR